MYACAELFINDLESKNFHFEHFEDGDGDVIVKFPYDNRVTTCIFVGEEGRMVSMYTVFEKVPDEKLTDLYAVCNGLNAKYKWVKFYVDSMNNLVVQDDAILVPENAAAECFELIARRFNIMNECKPIVMRALYA